MAGETPIPAVEIGEGGKLQLNRDAKTAFGDKAQSVEFELQKLNGRLSDANTAKWFAKLRGKLAAENADTVRQEVAAKLSAVMASLPDQLAKADNASSMSIARFETLHQLEAIIRDELNAFIQEAIKNPDRVATLAKKMAGGARQAGGGRHDQIARATEEAR